jgi:hypothetical protein
MWLGMAVEHVWMALHGAPKPGHDIRTISAQCGGKTTSVERITAGVRSVEFAGKQVWRLGNFQFALGSRTRSAVPVQTSPQRPKSAPDRRLTSEKEERLHSAANAPLRGVWGVWRVCVCVSVPRLFWRLVPLTASALPFSALISWLPQLFPPGPART